MIFDTQTITQNKLARYLPFLQPSLSSIYNKTKNMRDWLRTLLAGAAAYRWGGGCLGTIVVFLIVYWALGHC